MLEIGLDDIRLGGSASTRDEAIALVGRTLVERGYIEPPYVEAMHGRERLGSTFLGNGIAIPHGLPEARAQVRQTGVVVVQFPQGVPWSEGGRVHLAVGIAAKSDEHVQVLANLTGVLGDPTAAARLAVTADRGEIAAYLNGKKAVATAEAVVARGATRTVVAPVPHGLHARPSTVLVEVAKRFESEIALRFEKKTANAKSLVSLLRLGAVGGAELTVSAEGPDASAALEAIAEAFARGLGEGQTPAAPQAPAPEPRGLLTLYAGKVLAGVSASPGIATGKVWHFKRENLVVRQHAHAPEIERERLHKALAGASAELSHLHEEFWKKAGADRAAIFKAHLELLEDPEMTTEAHRRIAGGESAGWAWRETYEERAATLAGLKDPLLAARAGDLRDVGRRVLRLLADDIEGQGETQAPDHPVIIVAEDLAPSDTAKLDPRQVLGLCTAGGGATSHTAIIARSLDLPAVVAAGPAVLDLANGQECILDGDSGVLVSAPTPADREAATKRQQASLARREEERRSCYEPALTTDGVRIEVVANIGAPTEAAAAVNGGAEGIGLVRTEFLFLHRDTPPSEDEQVEAYETILRPMHGLPVIMRTLDIGGDKDVSYLEMPAEENPFLGVRGLRLCLQRPDLFRTQLRALFRASRVGPVRLMFPMVTMPDELAKAKAIAEEVRREVGAKPVPVGIMIEVPAAVVMADQLAREVDFFSIGTNDLTQYVLAMDRGHPVLAPQADGLHPAVLRMVRRTVEAAKGAGIWVGACGGIAGDPAGAMMLAGLGVAELSVSIPSIAAIKARLRGLSMRRLEELARRALDCRTAAEVRALAREG